MSGLFPVMAFQDAFPILQKYYKVRILQSDSHPMRSCEANSIDLLNAIEKGIGLDANEDLIPEKMPSRQKIFSSLLIAKECQIY